MLAAGYAVYGVSTLLVVASSGGAALYQAEHSLKTPNLWKGLLRYSSKINIYTIVPAPYIEHRATCTH